MVPYQFGYTVQDEVGGYTCYTIVIVTYFHIAMVNNKKNTFGCFN